MNRPHLWLYGIAAIILALGTIYFVALRGGEIQTPAVFGQSASYHIPGPTPAENEQTSSSSETLEPPFVPTPSVVGIWDGTVVLGNDPTAHVSIRFYDSGAYEVSTDISRFDPGRWIQNDRSVTWKSQSDTEYYGTLRGTVLSGTTQHPTGNFYLRRRA